MNYRIEVAPRREWHDARGEKTKKQIIDFLKIQIDGVRTRDVYTVSADITAADAARIAEYLTNPVLQTSRVGGNALTADDNGCRFLVIVGFKPGVTDNVARTAKEAIADIIGRKLTKDEDVFYMYIDDGGRVVTSKTLSKGAPYSPITRMREIKAFVRDSVIGNNGTSEMTESIYKFLFENN